MEKAQSFTPATFGNGSGFLPLRPHLNSRIVTVSPLAQRFQLLIMSAVSVAAGHIAACRLFMMHLWYGRALPTPDIDQSALTTRRKSARSAQVEIITVDQHPIGTPLKSSRTLRICFLISSGWGPDWVLFHIRDEYMAALVGWDRWQVHADEGRRKYLSADERTGFLAAADRLAPAARALCHMLAYAGCRVSEALVVTAHHLDAELLTLTIRTLKRRRTVSRIVPVPQMVVDLLQTVPLDERGRFLPMHRATAWRMVKATMARAGITAHGLAQRPPPRLRHVRRRPQCPD